MLSQVSEETLASSRGSEGFRSVKRQKLETSGGISGAAELDASDNDPIDALDNAPNYIVSARNGGNIR